MHRCLGDLSLQHAEIEFPVFFDGFTFEGNVSFCRDHFYSVLSITKSIFKSSVNFCAAKGNDSIFFTDSEFWASADFLALEVNGDLGFQRTTFAYSAQFAKASIHADLSLKKMSKSEIRRDLSLKLANFCPKCHFCHRFRQTVPKIATRFHILA